MLIARVFRDREKVTEPQFWPASTFAPGLRSNPPPTPPSLQTPPGKILRRALTRSRNRVPTRRVISKFPLVLIRLSNCRNRETTAGRKAPAISDQKTVAREALDKVCVVGNITSSGPTDTSFSLKERISQGLQGCHFGTSIP